MGSWSDKLVASEKAENKDTVDCLHLGAAIAFLKADQGLTPVEASSLDYILSKAKKAPMTVEQLKTANDELATAYLAEIWR